MGSHNTPLEGRKTNCSKTQKPWLDQHGKLYSDGALRTISQHWSTEIWESFLRETVDRPLREEPQTPQQLDRFSKEEICKFWLDLQPKDVSSNQKFMLGNLIRRKLTPRQQQVLRLIYWEGMSERAAAKVLGVDRSTVAASKKRSLRKLKGLLENTPATPATSKGKSNEKENEVCHEKTA